MLTKSSPKHDKADQSRKMTGWGRDPAFGLAAVNSAVEVMAGSGIFKIEPRLQLDGAVQAQAQKQERKQQNAPCDLQNKETNKRRMEFNS
jgi:hypothetical protein